MTAAIYDDDIIGAPAARAVAEAARGAVRVHVPVGGHPAGAAARPRLGPAQPRQRRGFRLVHVLAQLRVRTDINTDIDINIDTYA